MKTSQLLIATTNQGKLKEFEEMLRPLGILLVTPLDVPAVKDLDVEEIGETFAEIALLKAHTFALKTGLMSVADDSGLEIMALNGQPGIKSKRFISGSDHDRNLKVLELMSPFPDIKQRQARFVTVLCLYDPATQEYEFFEGEVKGSIAQQEQGQQGFGYDPIFIPEGYTQTFAELGADVKNVLSHRARAIAKLKDFISTQHQ